MSAEILSAIAGSLLSLLFSYVPGLSTWYDKLGYDVAGNYDDGLKKRLVMLGLLFLVAAGAMGLSCAGWGADFGLSLSCDRAGVSGLLNALLLGVMANQSTYSITTKSTK